MTSAVELDAGRWMSSVDVCRSLAASIWRNQMRAEHLRICGLNNQAEVRRRLAEIAKDLAKQSDLRPDHASRLAGILFHAEDPLSALEKSEALVNDRCPGSYPNVEALLSADRSEATRLVVELMTVQCLAGRLGSWAVRLDEIADAKIAHRLLRPTVRFDWSDYCPLINQGSEAFEAADYARAAQLYLQADSLVRTPAMLFQAANCLHRLGDVDGALWAVRTGLLERTEAFDQPGSVVRARALEERLRAKLEARSLQTLIDSRDEPMQAHPISDVIARKFTVGRSHSSEDFSLVITRPVPGDDQPDAFEESTLVPPEVTEKNEKEQSEPAYPAIEEDTQQMSESILRQSLLLDTIAAVRHDVDGGVSMGEGREMLDLSEFSTFPGGTPNPEEPSLRLVSESLDLSFEAYADLVTSSADVFGKETRPYGSVAVEELSDVVDLQEPALPATEVLAPLSPTQTLPLPPEENGPCALKRIYEVTQIAASPELPKPVRRRVRAKAARRPISQP